MDNFDTSLLTTYIYTYFSTFLRYKRLRTKKTARLILHPDTASTNDAGPT